MSAVSTRLARITRAVLWIAYGADWLGGVGSHFLFGGTPPAMRWAAPVFLLLATFIVIVTAPEEWRSMTIAFALGFVFEAIGVATGFPFGSYIYSGVLAPSVLGVPLVMAGAWMILIEWVSQLSLPVWAGAVVMIGVDLTLDPLACGTLGFWQWRSGGAYYGVPFMNFLGWFGASLLILYLTRAKPRRSLGVFLAGLSIPLFFVLIGMAHGFWVPSSFGFAVCVFGYARWRSSSVSTRI